MRCDTHNGYTDSGYYVIGYRGKETTVTIPDTYKGQPVICIGNDAFYATGISRVCLPASLQAINARAFYNCTNLAYVELPEQNNLNYISNSAFYNTSLLNQEIEGYVILGNVLYGYEPLDDTVLTVPEGIKYICGYFPNITTLNLPSTLIGIGDRAFDDSDLTTINIPQVNSLVQVGEDILLGTPIWNSYEEYEMMYLGNVALGLKYTSWEGYEADVLEIPEGTVGIAAYAFCNIPVSKVILPSSLRYIGDSAFAYYKEEITRCIEQAVIPDETQLQRL